MLKEEMRNSFAEMEKKTNKNWKASTNPLKKTKKNQTRYSRLENWNRDNETKTYKTIEEVMRKRFRTTKASIKWCINNTTKTTFGITTTNALFGRPDTNENEKHVILLVYYCSTCFFPF